MPDQVGAAGQPAEFTERVRLARESGDLDAIRDLLHRCPPRAPEGPDDADCQNHCQSSRGGARRRIVVLGRRMTVDTEIGTGGRRAW
jgi:hypothetical protein